MAYIYKITNKINGKMYIGKTERTVAKRFSEHLASASKSELCKRPLYSAIRLYGKDAFEIEILEETDIPLEREIFYIEKFDTYKNGYNATKGGEGTYTVNKEKVVAMFQSGYSVKRIAKELGHDPRWIASILKNQNIDYLSRSSSYTTKSVFCTTLLKRFSSASEASMYLVKILNKSCNPVQYGSHITACCKGKRKSVFGFRFEYCT